MCVLRSTDIDGIKRGAAVALVNITCEIPRVQFIQ